MYEEASCVFSALAVPEETRSAAFEQIREFRKAIRQSDGVFLHKELHAWKFVGPRADLRQGCGQDHDVANCTVTRWP